MQVIDVADHEHFIISMLSAISSAFFTSSSVFSAISSIFPAMATLAFAESGWIIIQRKVGNWMGGLYTFIMFNRRPPSLSYDHPDLLVYQTIQSFERILNI
jgi:hypothetical protein